MIKRELYMKQIESLVNQDIIKIITGIRRCGKSTFLRMIIEKLKENNIKEENILLIDLEIPKYNHITTREQLDEIIIPFMENKNTKTYLFVDEIQKVKNWEISINGYYKAYNTDIYITGSNSKLLSKELATLLTGRYIELKMYPFSFNEFIEYKKELGQNAIYDDEIKMPIENLFDEYVQYGGLPQVISNIPANKNATLEGLYSSILLNDIVERYQIRNVGLLNRITRYLIENMGNLISANNIYKYLKHEKINITPNTVYNYLDYIEKSFFLSKVTREDTIGKKELTGSEKYYLIDQGFYKAILEEKQENKGKLLENIVYMELLRQNYKITIGKLKDYEIDFICRKNNEKIYIQVTQTLIDEKTRKREYRPLLDIKDNYPKYIISTDKQNYSQDGIKHLNIIHFLTKTKTELV